MHLKAAKNGKLKLHGVQCAEPRRAERRLSRPDDITLMTKLNVWTHLSAQYSDLRVL